MTNESTDYAELVNGLKERAENAAQEGNMTATCDARYFSQSADAIETLVRERDEANRLKDNWCNVAQDFCRERDEARAERDKGYALFKAANKEGCAWADRAEAAEAEVARLREALWRLIEYTTDERCSLDHHGYCQAHGYMDTGCPVGVARAALEEAKHD